MSDAKMPDTEPRVEPYCDQALEDFRRRVESRPYRKRNPERLRWLATIAARDARIAELERERDAITKARDSISADLGRCTDLWLTAEQARNTLAALLGQCRIYDWRCKESARAMRRRINAALKDEERSPK